MLFDVATLRLYFAFFSISAVACSGLLQCVGMSFTWVVL